jgi:tetratricopeptide (TPR) repeat protein
MKISCSVLNLILVLVGLALPVRAALDEVEVSGLFKEGSDLFKEANEVYAADASQAEDLYEKAALRFERVVREGGIENGKLYYNIGNAYFRAGDLGRSILNFRKAEQFNPNDPNVQQNLAYARSQRKDELAEKGKTKMMHILLFWHYDFSFEQRFTLFAVCFALLWIAVGVRLFAPRPFLKWIIGLAGLASAVLGISLVVESLAIKNERPGVVLAEAVTARKGDSESYEASFQEPLHAGAEFVLVEERKNWVQVELPDGRTCWLPSGAVAMVR